MSSSQVSIKKYQHVFPKQIQKLNIVSDINLERDLRIVELKHRTGKQPTHDLCFPKNHGNLPHFVSQVVILRMELRIEVQLVLTGNKTRVSLTHILNEEGVCLLIHLDVFKIFQ